MTHRLSVRAFYITEKKKNSKKSSLGREVEGTLLALS